MILAPPAYLPIHVWRGIDLTPITITVRDSDSQPVNLAGYSVAWGSRSLSWLPFGNLASITDPANGQITIQATRQQTANFRIGQFPWDSYLLTPQGVTIGPYVIGDIIVREMLAPSGFPPAPAPPYPLQEPTPG
jgi:hypothetical protein